jgi:hypothetical protein
MALYLSIPRKRASSLPAGAAACGALVSEGENLPSQLQLQLQRQLEMEAPVRPSPQPPTDAPTAEIDLHFTLDEDITVRVSADELRRLVARAFAA